MSDEIEAWPGNEAAEQTNAVLSDWDRVDIGGVQLPGLARISGKLGRKVDVMHAPERFGATLTDLGTAPAKFQIRLQLWTRRHLDDWELLAKQLLPPPKKRNPKPIDIFHPALALHGVWRVYVLEIAFLEPDSISGVWKTTLDCIEWRPASPAEAIIPASAGVDLTKVANVAARTPSVRGAAEP